MSEEVKNKSEYLVEVRDLKQYFPIKTGFMKTTPLKAVDGVSFSIKPGETLGLVGESGCGKTTVGRSLLRLYTPTSGDVFFDGERVNEKSIGHMRRQMQMVFQDPYSSLSPRLPVGEIIGETVREHNLVPKSEYADYVTKIMDDCGLQSYQKDRYPHEFSGGQRQRIGIARALITKPDFIVCDEPISALDVSIQAQVVNMLQDLQDELGLTLVMLHQVVVQVVLFPVLEHGGLFLGQACAHLKQGLGQIQRTVVLRLILSQWLHTPLIY